MNSKNLLLALLLSLTTSVFAASSSGKTYDAHFLDKMSKHHIDGIEMAKMAQSKTSNKQIIEMSQKMIKDQKEEVQQMQKWRKDLYSGVPKSSDLPDKMNMSELEKAKGDDFDKMFLSMMSKHHQSGIQMFEEAEENASNSKIKEFAVKASSKQSQEQDHMKHMQKGHDDTSM